MAEQNDVTKLYEEFEEAFVDVLTAKSEGVSFSRRMKLPAAPPKPAPQPQAAPWKDYVNSDGSIRSTPRGRWDV